MDIKDIQDFDLMGENVRPRLKSCGEGVKLNQFAKIVKPEVVELGDHCRICDFGFIYGGTGVKIGKYTDFQPHTTIWGGGECVIGDRVSTGPGTTFLTATYSYAPGMKMVDGLGDGNTKTLGGKCEIGNDVYIGANCVIMPVKIGEGAVVGAGSFVNKDLEPWGVYVGSPARKIAEREKLK